MKKSISQHKNLEFWDNMAKNNTGHEVSWWDVNMKKIEVKHIIPYLSRSDIVLDAGCSNGASTLEICEKVKCHIHGIDYSKKSIAQTKKIKNKLLTFEYADIVNYQPGTKYDKIFSIRCLINIMNEKNQQTALTNIHKLLKSKGIYIMAEAFWGGLNNLNKARKLFNLKPLIEPKYNLYFREKKFEKFIKNHFKILEIQKYSSLYYVGTRLFQYLSLNNDPTEKNTKLHRFFADYDFETKNSGDFSPQKIYILQKR